VQVPLRVIRNAVVSMHLFTIGAVVRRLVARRCRTDLPAVPACRGRRHRPLASVVVQHVPRKWMLTVTSTGTGFTSRDAPTASRTSWSTLRSRRNRHGCARWIVDSARWLFHRRDTKCAGGGVQPPGSDSGQVACPPVRRHCSLSPTTACPLRRHVPSRPPWQIWQN